MNIYIAASAALFAVLCAPSVSFSQDITITKNPKVYYLTSAGLNSGYSRHETLSSAFADVQAILETEAGPVIEALRAVEG